MRQGMNVARMNMSHGDHKSHKAVVDLVKEYNLLGRGNVALMLDTKGPEVRSGDLSEPIDMKAGGVLGKVPMLQAGQCKGLLHAVLTGGSIQAWNPHIGHLLPRSSTRLT